MKTLPEKLGYRAGTPALVWRLPDGLRDALAGLTPADVGATPAFRIAFVRSRAELAEAAAAVAAAHRPGDHLWLCYPKKGGRLKTDVTRDVGWEPVHALDLLGVAQVALDDTWSALRFRRREEIRTITRRTPTGGAPREAPP